MSTEHTPGPWVAVEYEKDGGAAFVRIGDITVEGSYRGSDSDTLSISDARLIAAAPDLLEALQALLVRVTKGYDGLPQGHGVRIAEAAIAKATGSAS
jgi:hypothetical protein